MSHPRAWLKLYGEQTVAAVEGWLGELQAQTSMTDISVNTVLRNAQVGGVAAIIQFILTWSKKFPTGRLLLHTNSPAEAEKQIENLAATDHGLVALLSAGDIVTSDGKESVREPALASTQRRLDALCGPIRAEPDTVFISSDASTAHLNTLLYYPASGPFGKLRPQAEFEVLAAEQVRRLATIHHTAIEPDPILVEHLATILYELFKNTDRWARHDLDGNEIPRSVRGVRMSYIRVDSTPQTAYTTQQSSYLKRLKAAHSFDLCELTVFDKGPGLAARGLERPISSDVTIEEEYAALRGRLLEHATTSAKTSHGVGLFEVMQALTRGNCFLRIRSGHLALSRDFVANRMPDSAQEEDVWLQDEQTLGRPIARPWAEGVLFSILLPIFKERS